MVLASACLPSMAQSLLPGKPSRAAEVRGIQILPKADDAALEIVSTRPLTPEIQELKAPSRLVIDLAGANLGLLQKRITFSNQQIRRVRVDQFQKTPPVTRVVVDLLAPIAYTWEANGNHLMVHLRPQEQLAEPPPPPKPDWGLASLARTTPMALTVSSANSGALLLVGDRLAVKSSFTAGPETAVLNLARGGEVRVCPGTTVSLTPSPNNQALMLGISTGALEEHATLGASADTVLTPDFRILLAGPGELHYAFHVDSHGNTCVQALPGNTASAMVSELLGDGSYQVKPEEGVVFRSGRIELLDPTRHDDCGCPAPPVPAVRASADILNGEPKSPIHLGDGQADSGEFQVVQSGGVLPAGNAKSGEIHVQLDAPFVFRAAKPVPRDLHDLPLARPVDPEVLPASSVMPPRGPHRGFMRKLKGVFAAIFS